VLLIVFEKFCFGDRSPALGDHSRRSLRSPTRAIVKQSFGRSRERGSRYRMLAATGTAHSNTIAPSRQNSILSEVLNPPRTGHSSFQEPAYADWRQLLDAAQSHLR
jgi:hypothetical protein